MAAKRGESKQPPARDSFTVSEAQDSLGTLLGRVEFGREEITITKGKNRKPVAKLVPVAAA